MRSQPNTAGEPSRELQRTATLRRRVGLAQISANLMGAVTCSIYFTFLDPAEALPQVDQLLLVSGLLTLGFILIGTFWGVRWHNDIQKFFHTLRQGRTPSDQLRARAQRKVINSPYFGAALSMAIWLLAAVFFSIFVLTNPHLRPGESSALYNAFRVFVGVVAAGVASSSIVFFSFEAIYRPLLPLVFPEGGLAGTSGVLRLNLRRRLLFSYFLVGVAPILIVGLIFFYKVSSLTRAVAFCIS